MASPPNIETPYTTAPSTGNSSPSTPTPPSLFNTQPPGTPYLQFTPKRAMTSFENLVALANHQERLKEARKMVWRDKGQPVVELETLRACLEHAGSGGLRSATLAFGIRAGVNLVLALIRIRNVSRELRFSLIRHAIFGTDTFRFAAMLGTFASTYKFLINALPLLIPALKPKPRRHDSPFHDDDEDDNDVEIDLEAGRRQRGKDTFPRTTTIEVPLAERRARLSLSAHAQLILIRKKTRRWHAAFAGALAGGVAIMWETRSRRGVIAQQMFVRGLQGSYNAYTTKRNIHVPHGDVLVFSLACGQILYGFLMRPDTLPRSYSAWIGQAAKVPAECVRINHDLVREGVFNIADVDRLTARKDITPHNLSTLLSLRSLATSIPPSYGPGLYAPCAATHPAIDACSAVPLDRFLTVFKWMLPIYGALHFIPAVLFKRASFMKEPGKMLMRAGWGTTRSSAFLGVFVVIYQTAFCYKHNLHAYLTAPSSPFKLPRAIIDLLISKGSFWVLGFLSGLSLFVEAKRRRGELAMYVLPKGLESMWVMARGKGLVFRTGNYGEMLLTAIGMGMVMSTYQNDPQHLSGLVRRVLYQFIGPN